MLDATDRDVATCHLDEPLDAVRERLQSDDACIVVDERNVVFGRLHPRRAADGATSIADAMEAGPSSNAWNVRTSTASSSPTLTGSSSG